MSARRCLLLASIGIAWAGADLFAAEGPAESPKPWNVLFLSADDWRPDLACYGTPGMITPNLDHLAEGGVRFDRAYCQFPVCNPSRASMLTGCYANQTGVVFNGTRLRDLHPDWVTLPELFKQHGYVTANAGKIFHGKIPDPQSWTEQVPEAVPREYRRTSAAKTAAANKPGDGDDESSGAPGARYVILEGNGESDKDYHIAEAGIRLLEKYKDQPFFIGVGFHRPHAVPTAPQRFYDMYDLAKIPLPVDFAPGPKLPIGIPNVALPESNDTYMSGAEVTPDVAREVIRAYRASASWTDWNMGRVLEALERLGLADRTIVVFHGDHGYHNGEKGRWGKTTVFDIALRVPLIIRAPRFAAAGQACERTVQLIDLYPTLAQLCELPLPTSVPTQSIQGHSLVPLLRCPRAAWDHPAFSMAKTGGGPLGYSVCTERWHYAEWNHGEDGAVLFDNLSDPHELKNLADDPKQAERVVEMKKLLEQTFGTMPVRLPKPTTTTSTGS
ncbi:MAG TPA: sulfatase [Pirellulales bacterium]|nr:sulfatase [Pirellulales bacterium]